MLRYVDTEALNFRATPRVEAGNVIGLLHLCQAVEMVAQVDGSDWVEVSATVGGDAKTGFVSGKFLRAQVADARETLIAQAIVEWLRFEKGQGKEHKDPFAGFVGQMWEAIGRADLDGRDRDMPWSAAAISFMVRNAGAHVPMYNSFRFSAAHARYIHDAIVKRERNDQGAPFWGYRLFEKRPELGDLVCRWRKSAIDFDDAAAQDRFSSHCDIVVHLGSDHVLAIGGNVSHSVSITRYDKTASGFLDDTKKVFALLGNRAA